MKKINYKVLLSFVAIMACYMFTIDVASAIGANHPEVAKKWNNLMVEYRTILAGIAGFGALTSIVVFIYHMIQLGSMPDHPIQRSQIMRNLLISAICTAGLGGITLFLTLFYSIVFG